MVYKLLCDGFRAIGIDFSESLKPLVRKFAEARKTFFVRTTCWFAWFVSLSVSLLGLAIDDVHRTQFILVQLVLFMSLNTILLGIVYFLPKQRYNLYFIFHSLLTLGIYWHVASLSERYAQFYTPIATLELFLGAALLPAFSRTAIWTSAFYWLGIAMVRYFALPKEFDLQMSWILANTICLVSIGSSIVYFGLFANLTRSLRALKQRIIELNEATSLLNITMSESEYGLIGFDADGMKSFERGAPFTRLWSRSNKDDGYDNLEELERLIEQNFEFEFSALFRSMQEVAFNQKHYMLRAHDLQDRVVISHMDVSSIREVEDKLRQNQKLSLIGEITSGVAHNYNNALAIALSRLEAIDSKSDPEFWKEHIDPSIRAIRTSSVVSQKLLALSGRQNLKISTFDASQAVKSMESLIYSALGYGIKFHMDAKTEAFISTDKSEFESAVLNLIINAKNAVSRSHGQVLLSVRNEGRLIKVVVEDNGCGIPDEISDKIFDPFFSTQPHNSSTGLGLATVKGFVQQSNGVVEFESRPGNTKFYLFFPRAIAGAPDNETIIRDELEDKLSSAAALESIMVVDDTVEVAQSYAMLLKTLGYAVQFETSPVVALKRITEDQNLTHIFIDYSMPEMNGVTLARKLRKLRPKLKLYMLSGDVSFMENTSKVHDFLDGVLLKPVNAKELKSVMKAHRAQEIENGPIERAAM